MYVFDCCMSFWTEGDNPQVLYSVDVYKAKKLDSLSVLYSLEGNCFISVHFFKKIHKSQTLKNVFVHRKTLKQH